MPDHVHVLMTPTCPLEKAVQFIKGGFSYRVKKELGSNMEVWQKGFSDHRIRDAADFREHVAYIHWNPARKHLSESPQDYEYCSAHVGFEVDEPPRGLKPQVLIVGPDGATKGAPFQNNSDGGVPEEAPFQNNSDGGVPEEARFQNNSNAGAPEHASFQKEASREEREHTPIQITRAKIV
jgi:hypothetical protein